jgi:hypothetical protein
MLVQVKHEHAFIGDEGDEHDGQGRSAASSGEVGHGGSPTRSGSGACADRMGAASELRGRAEAARSLLSRRRAAAFLAVVRRRPTGVLEEGGDFFKFCDILIFFILLTGGPLCPHQQVD